LLKHLAGKIGKLAQLLTLRLHDFSSHAESSKAQPVSRSGAV